MSQKLIIIYKITKIQTYIFDMKNKIEPIWYLLMKFQTKFTFLH